MIDEDFDDTELLDEVIEPTDEQEKFEHFRVVADKGQGLLRVDKFLSNHLEKISRNRIQEAADADCLFANGKPVKSNYKVKPGDVVTIELNYPKQELTIIAQNIPLNIVYEDNDLLVINKAPGMVVHPGHGNYSGTMVNALAWHMKDNPLFAANDPRPGLVHRIDKETSGLLVVAKNEQAKTHLAAQFFNKTSERTYVALAWGVPPDGEGTITGYIGRNINDRRLMHVFDSEERGKWAVTHYKVLEDLGYVSIVECKLETGRTHQIRIHFKYLGYPLFNDSTYGGDSVLRGTTFTKYKQFVQNAFAVCPRQALHAKTLGFVHPTTGKFMQFDSEIPNDMTALFNKWRSYLGSRVEEE
jgi:23S rRNA pseudouridine1911/1915/1917 synthase